MTVFFRFYSLLACFLLGALWGADAGAVEVAGSQVEPGFYLGPVTVTLPEGVHYTLTGATPTVQSPVATAPLSILTTTVIRYATFSADGTQTGPVEGATYFINEPETRLMTLSLGIDPWRLFDEADGWFRAGHGADPNDWKKPGANWWTKKEHPTHFDLLEENGEGVFSGTVGFRMFGGMSRLHPQKSFSLSARERYGKKRIKHKIFGDAAGKSFQFLVARNAGSDWNRSYLRDALLTGLLQDESWDLERQAARPVQVYINGKYWGIYHLREKINPQFIGDRFPEVDKNKIDFLEHKESVKHGKLGAYRKLLRFVQEHDLAVPEHYRELTTLMDVDNYMRLQIAQTYFDNRDAGGNIRFWRPQTAAGRWRWILYDVDQGFGLHAEDAFTRNTLAFYTEADGPSWPNPPWSTLLQRKLLANAEYRRLFVNRTLDYLHTDFAPVTVAAATERRVTALAFDMPRQLARWQGKDKNWQLHLERVREFGQQRPAYLREHLRVFCAGGADREVTIIADPGGLVELNQNIKVDEASYTGVYFQNLPLHLRAVAHPGFRFTGWEGQSATAASLQLDLQADKPYQLRATFAAYDHPLANQIIFTEIQPSGTAGGDWLEVYNRGPGPADLTGCFLTDGGHQFQFPEATLAAGEYLVVCRNPEKFHQSHPTAQHVIDGLTFGLDKDGETLQLYGPEGGYLASVTYAISAPDASFSYALVRPSLDPTDARHWAVEPGPGTPGAANPDHLQTAVITTQDYWLRIGVGLGVLLLVGVVRVLKG